MAQDGEAIFDLFFLIPEDPLKTPASIDLPTSRLRECCSAFSLRALADLTTTDPFKNDVAGFLWWFNDVVSSAVLKLFKYDINVSDYIEIAVLNSTNYGTNYSYGFFVNDNAEKFVGYQLEWKKALTLHGEGSYKVKCEVTSSIGGNITLESPEYCLKHYSPERADGTVKIEYYLNNILGISSDDYKTKDLGSLNWYNSIRVPGYFGFNTSSYESDYIQYNNGQRVWVEDEQEPEFTLKLKPVAQYVHETMRTDILQADRILITDYNSKNPGSFIQKPVIKNSNYEPEWMPLKSKLAPVTVKFKQEFNNHKKLRC